MGSDDTQSLRDNLPMLFYPDLSTVPLASRNEFNARRSSTASPFALQELKVDNFEHVPVVLVPGPVARLMLLGQWSWGVARACWLEGATEKVHSKFRERYVPMMNGSYPSADWVFNTLAAMLASENKSLWLRPSGTSSQHVKELAGIIRRWARIYLGNDFGADVEAEDADEVNDRRVEFETAVSTLDLPPFEFIC